MATQTGPRLRVVSECTDCEHLREKSYAAQGDSGYVVSCAHPDGKGRIGDTTWTTPAWCPELPAARLALARSVVAAEAPCQVSLVRQIGGNLPCVRKGEHAEHQSACGRRWGGEDFTDHPDFDSRAFCDDGSEAP